MKDIVNPQIWECNTQVIPKVGLSIWDFTCDSQNGNWLFFPVIKANCRSPGDINHGLKIGNNYKHGKTVRYSCNAGFTLEGEAEVTCEEGTWNTDTPKCKGTFVSVHEFVFRDI